MVRSGYAELVLPLPAGQPLMGHIRDVYEAKGTHDDLYCKALVFQEDDRIVGLVMLDLCMVDASFVDEAKGELKQKLGLVPEYILIGATHTHAGPAVFSIYGAPVMENRVRQDVIETIVETVRAACTTIEPVEMRFGAAACADQIGYCRRLRLRDGTTAMNWQALGPDDVVAPLGTYDATVRLLQITGNSLHVWLVNYPLHPAILDYGNLYYSRDYPGYLEKAVKQMATSEVQVVFANGCCGNINHIDYHDADMPRRGYGAAQRVGYILASATMEAMRTAVAMPVAHVLRSQLSVSLPRIAVPDSLLQEAVHALQEKPVVCPSDIDGLSFALQAPLICELASMQDLPLQSRTSVMMIGPMAVFGFPGEMTYEMQQWLASLVGNRPWMAIELADDAIGYVCHQDAYREGGYETQVGVAKVAAGAAELLFARLADEFRRLVGGM